MHVYVTEPLDHVGYCGFVCTICLHSDDGCPGCRLGGGNEHCVQRRCCEHQRLDGCWQCADFPCDEGYLADDEWRGLCVACSQGIKAKGIETFVDRARSRLGEMVDYADFRHKDALEIAHALR